ncbi:WD40-like protein [Cooperia oncophora]
MDIDGTNKKQVTFDGRYFDGFPMFSHDGKKLVWSSTRGSTNAKELNVFIADWVGFHLRIQEIGAKLEKAKDRVESGEIIYISILSRTVPVSEELNNHPTLSMGETQFMLVDSETSASDEVAAKEELRTNRVPKRCTKGNTVRWQDTPTTPYDNVVHFDGERHFKNVKQLTFGGENAEGYFRYA